MFDALGADVVQQQDAGLVAGKQDVLAVFVLDGDAHPVAVRVGAQQQVGLAALGVFQFQCLDSLQ